MDRSIWRNAEDNDFRNMDTWRIFRIMAEFVEGFEAMAQYRNGVSVFGSARTPEKEEHYHLGVEVGKLLAESGYTVITGGGPGIMEAANKGAYLENKKSVGLNIDLPHEQFSNKYVQKLISFRYFFCRKVMFSKYSKAVIVLPGGFGTLDELFEHLTLVQTQKIPPMPIILVDKKFWQGMIKWIEDILIKNKYISPEDKKLYHIVDTAEEAVKIVCQSCPIENE